MTATESNCPKAHTHNNCITCASLATRHYVLCTVHKNAQVPNRTANPNLTTTSKCYC
jgi:hypothetical protein